MARYGAKASKKVKKAMHERKRGTLKSGRSGKKVTSRKQAIAIGLSQARRAGGKVPRKKSKKKQEIQEEARNPRRNSWLRPELCDYLLKGFPWCRVPTVKFLGQERSPSYFSAK
jgi:hypothetical protein